MMRRWGFGIGARGLCGDEKVLAILKGFVFLTKPTGHMIA